MREINTYLAQGLEAKELVHEKNVQIRLQDSTISDHVAIISHLRSQILLLQDDKQRATDQVSALRAELKQCSKDKEQDHKDVARLRRARNRYAWISGIETAVLAGIIYLSVK